MATLAAAFLLAYLFHPAEILWYGKGIDAQKLHNRAADHATSFFGVNSAQGFWNYYLALFFFKSSPLQLLTIGAALVLAWQRRRQGWLAFTFFVLPAMALFFYLSRLHVQLGYRYALPAVAALFFTSSLAFEKFSARGQAFRPRPAISRRRPRAANGGRFSGAATTRLLELLQFPSPAPPATSPTATTTGAKVAAATGIRSGAGHRHRRHLAGKNAGASPRRAVAR